MDNPNKPHPYCMDASRTTATFGADRHGKYGAWISISGEWVRLEAEEVHRLMKKRNQAEQIRKQWEKETSPHVPTAGQ